MSTTTTEKSYTKIFDDLCELLKSNGCELTNPQKYAVSNLITIVAESVEKECCEETEKLLTEQMKFAEDKARIQESIIKEKSEKTVSEKVAKLVAEQVESVKAELPETVDYMKLKQYTECIDGIKNVIGFSVNEEVSKCAKKYERLLQESDKRMTRAIQKSERDLDDMQRTYESKLKQNTDDVTRAFTRKLEKAEAEKKALSESFEKKLAEAIKGAQTITETMGAKNKSNTDLISNQGATIKEQSEKLKQSEKIISEQTKQLSESKKHETELISKIAELEKKINDYSKINENISKKSILEKVKYYLESKLSDYPQYEASLIRKHFANAKSIAEIDEHFDAVARSVSDKRNSMNFDGKSIELTSINKSLCESTNNESLPEQPDPDDNGMVYVNDEDVIDQNTMALWMSKLS